MYVVYVGCCGGSEAWRNEVVLFPLLLYPEQNRYSGPSPKMSR